MKLPPDERLRAEVGKLLDDVGESSAPPVLEPIVAHLRLLARWNDAYNLTRITGWPEVLDRHVGEALVPLKYLPRGPGRFLDVGTGNGFPAIPILACRPELTGVLLERSGKTGLFLDAFILEAGWAARVRVDATDAERLEPTEQELFDVVISRATLPPERLLALAPRWVRPGGQVFMYAGRDVGGRQAAASDRLILKRTTREPLKDRTDSYLHVLVAEANTH